MEDNKPFHLLEEAITLEKTLKEVKKLAEPGRELILRLHEERSALITARMNYLDKRFLEIIEAKGYDINHDHIQITLRLNPKIELILSESEKY